MYKTDIFEWVSQLIERVRTAGVDNGKCIEIKGVYREMTDISYFQGGRSFLDSIDRAIAKFYEKKEFGIQEYIIKMEQERYHYEQLKYTLLQKIEFNRFYFKENVLETRKLVAHSEDCISTIQLLPRPQELNIMLFMRSSDVENLLAPDISGILRIVNEIRTKIYPRLIRNKIKVNMSLLIGSAHLYPHKDKRRVDFEQ